MTTVIGWLLPGGSPGMMEAIAVVVIANHRPVGRSRRLHRCRRPPPAAYAGAATARSESEAMLFGVVHGHRPSPWMGVVATDASPMGASRPFIVVPVYDMGIALGVPMPIGDTPRGVSLLTLGVGHDLVGAVPKIGRKLNARLLVRGRGSGRVAVAAPVGNVAYMVVLRDRSVSRTSSSSSDRLPPSPRCETLSQTTSAKS